MNERTNLLKSFEILQVHPGCSPRELEQAYHHFAKLYHPDNIETADPDKFSEVVSAYKALRDTQRRKEFEEHYNVEHHTPDAGPSGVGGSQAEALRDANAHAVILQHLYRQRRESPGNPGLGSWELEHLIGCSPTEFEFHTWYLRAKNLVEITEMGTLAITIEGVDHVIAVSRTEEAVKLMITHEAAVGFDKGESDEEA